MKTDARELERPGEEALTEPGGEEGRRVERDFALRSAARRYSGRLMRLSKLAAVALASALLGGVGAVLVARELDLVSAETTKTVVLPGVAGTPALEAREQAPNGNAKPLLGNGFQPARIYAERSPGVVTIYAFFDDASPEEHAAQGSGFVVSSTGYVLTSAHVITTAGSKGKAEPADRVLVTFKDRDRIPATVVGWDLYDDVGVLRVGPKAHSLAPVPLGDSSRVVVGEPVAALGSPFGNENSLTVGVVSATRRSISSLTSQYQVADALQTDAPITHGNSGGPLFDARGRVIGINAQIRSESGQAEGVGFAIPINAAKRSLNQLIATGRVAYAYVGIRAEDLTPTIARHFGYPAGRGAVIASVEPGSPGAKAGLREGDELKEFNGERFRVGGDVIVSIGGRPVRSADDMVQIVSERLLPGQVVTFTILRGKQRRTVTVKLGERPANPRLAR